MLFHFLLSSSYLILQIPFRITPHPYRPLTAPVGASAHTVLYVWAVKSWSPFTSHLLALSEWRSEACIDTVGSSSLTQVICQCSRCSQGACKCTAWTINQPRSAHFFYEKVFTALVHDTQLFVLMCAHKDRWGLGDCMNAQLTVNFLALHWKYITC